MKDKWVKLEGRGVTVPDGFKASGISCGLKNGKKDLAAIFTEYEAQTAGVFTRNLVCAAPVKQCQTNLTNPIQLVIINSGNANACTGDQGRRDAWAMAENSASYKGHLDSSQVMVCSTGVIGVPLDMKKINTGLKRTLESLGEGEDFDKNAAEAIMTTDTRIKQSAYRCITPDGDFHLAGMAKGSGMICPNMATMLAFLTTDVKIDRSLLQELFTDAVNRSFNVITVDGDTSTNDTALILANGARNKMEVTETSALFDPFKQILNQVCQELAYMIVADGEGATKLITLSIKGSRDEESARILSRSVLNSPLVKTAFFGEDANWGRILAALGYSGVDFDPEKVDIYIGPYQVAANGGSVPFSEVEMKKVLQQREIKVSIDLKQGNEELIAWGTDMSIEYVEINSDYRS